MIVQEEPQAQGYKGSSPVNTLLPQDLEGCLRGERLSGRRRVCGRCEEGVGGLCGAAAALGKGSGVAKRSPAAAAGGAHRWWLGEPRQRVPVHRRHHRRDHAGGNPRWKRKLRAISCMGRAPAVGPAQVPSSGRLFSCNQAEVVCQMGICWAPTMW